MSAQASAPLEIFNNLDLRQMALIKPLFVPLEYQEGETIFMQGEGAEYLYLVVEGEVSIQYKPEDGPALVVARIHQDGVVGWSAALGSPVYTSSAVCSAPTRLLRVRGDDLRTLCENHPDTGALLLERLAAMIAVRLRNTHEHVIALLQVGLKISQPATY